MTNGWNGTDAGPADDRGASGTRQMRICVFGCGDFLGARLVEWLLEHTNARVIGADTRHRRVAHLLSNRRFTYYDSELRLDHDLVGRLIEAADVVVNLSAVSRRLIDPNELEVSADEQRLQLDIIRHCATLGRRLVHVSTGEVYGRSAASIAATAMTLEDDAVAPTMIEDESPMISGPLRESHWTEITVRQLLERVIETQGWAADLDYTIVRPFNVVGAGFEPLPSALDGGATNALAEFLAALVRGAPLPVVEGPSPRRTFVSVDDAADGIGRAVALQSADSRRQVINIGNPANQVSMSELAMRARLRYDRDHRRAGEPLSELTPVPPEEFFGEGFVVEDHHVPDIAKAGELLGWTPRTSLDEILRETIDAYVAQRMAAPGSAHLAG